MNFCGLLTQSGSGGGHHSTGTRSPTLLSSTCSSSICTLFSELDVHLSTATGEPSEPLFRVRDHQTRRILPMCLTHVEYMADRLHLNTKITPTAPTAPLFSRTTQGRKAKERGLRWISTVQGEMRHPAPHLQHFIPFTNVLILATVLLPWLCVQLLRNSFISNRIRLCRIKHF